LEVEKKRSTTKPADRTAATKPSRSRTALSNAPLLLDVAPYRRSTSAPLRPVSFMGRSDVAAAAAVESSSKNILVMSARARGCRGEVG